ncbi:MAG TPA: hypothetical protein VI318_26260 [Baekduia sp.]
MDDFAERSAVVRRELRPVVEAALRRYAGSFSLEEPEAAMGIWLVAVDSQGREMLKMSAHADSVNFVIGQDEFLYYIDSPYDWDELPRVVARIVEASCDASTRRRFRHGASEFG